MKKSIILVVNLLIILSVFSQTSSEKTTRKGKPKTEYCEITLGISFPNFDYENTLYKDGTGQAHIGTNLSLEASTLIKNKWGYKYDLNVTLYPGKKNNLSSEYTEIETGYWINLNFGLGAFVNLNWKKTAFNIGMNGGITTLSSPFVRYLYGETYIKSNSGFGIGCNIKPNLSIYYKIHDKIHLKFFINYLITPIMFETKSIRAQKNSWSVNGYEKMYIISSLNCGMGVQF